MLWDADGVLQRPSPNWVGRLHDIGGDGFAATVFELEVEALRGQRSMEDVVAVAMERHAVDAAPASVLALWDEIEVDEPAWAVLRSVRSAGVPCLLATNQHDRRMRVMRHDLGYDDRLDGSFYSCDIGAMKPDPAYFHAVLDRLSIPADQVAFIDDRADNVAAAADLGLRAVRHDPASGAAGLRADLTVLGIRV